MTAFYNVDYCCHECKKNIHKKRQTQMSIKMSILLYLHKRKKCEGKEIICEKCNKKFMMKNVLRIILRFDQRKKFDSVCDSVKK